MLIGSSPTFASFDSSTAFFNHLSDYIKYNLPANSKSKLDKKLFSSILSMFNVLPSKIKSNISANFGKLEALHSSKVKKVDTDKLAENVIAKYPKGEFDAIAIGSSNGALTHMYSAMNIPWLPQTLLLLLQRDNTTPDSLMHDYQMGRYFADKICEQNDNIAVYQMNDPSHDRNTAQRMSYLRLKYTKVPDAYKNYICENVKPGGVIYVIECLKKWPVTRLSDQHYYQVGGLGSITPEEYLYGSDIVFDFLRNEKSNYKKFMVPTPNDKRPEAEWGYDYSLTHDLELFARENNFRIKRIVFYEPQDASVYTAEMYRIWYRARGIYPKNVLIESFMLIDPKWVLENEFVPYWSAFNDAKSYFRTRRYIESSQYKTIFMLLFSNMTHAAGEVKGEEWEQILDLAKKGELIASDSDQFPFDASSAFTYQEKLKNKSDKKVTNVPVMTISEFEHFFRIVRQHDAQGTMNLIG